MAYINIRLTVFVLIPMPFIVLTTRFFSKKMHRNYQSVQEAFSDLTEMVRERFTGIWIIKAYNMETEETSRMNTISREFIKKNIKLVTIIGSFFPMMVFFSNLSLVFVLYFGGKDTIRTTITAGDFVAFISYLGLLTWPMMALGWVTNLIQRGRASLDRINRILKTEPEIVDQPAAKGLSAVKGKIIFEGVSFAYTSGSIPALTEVTFHVEPGQMLGIVGPPGSGKTTLLKLLPRVFDVSRGQILVDSEDIRSVKINDLRSYISFVPQEPFLFAGTIRDNILFGEKRDDKDLIRSVKAAALLKTVEDFTDRFETVIGEKGVILSGGQKQRLALARALLHQTPVLILDDPISQVDMETGGIIINTIRRMAKDRTIIIVSHRLSAVRFADTIIALDRGEIVESGNHEALMANNGYYAKTYRLQEIEEAYSVS
jgi:ATP-binding cassette subfamily B protein